MSKIHFKIIPFSASAACRETKYLQIAARNNAIKTNHFKAKIYNAQLDDKGRLCGDKNG